MMIRILLLLSQILAIFFLVVSGLLLILYNEQNKRSIKLWGQGLIIWAIATFLNIFAFYGTGEVSLVFYFLSRLVISFGFILFLFQGTLILLIPNTQAKLLAILFFFVTIGLDFTINMVEVGEIWGNIAFKNIYLFLPLTIVFFSYFYTYFIKLKEKIILEMALEWAILFLLSMFIIIFSSMGLITFLRVVLIIEYFVMVLLAFSFDRFRKQGDTWNKVTTPKTYVIDYDFLAFLNKELKQDTKPIIEKMLEKHGVQSITDLKIPGQKEVFIDNLLSNNFNELSPQRKAIIKTKIIGILGLNSNHWRTADSQ